MATAAKKKASALKTKKAPDLSKVKHIRATGNPEWKNKTIAEAKVSDGHFWRAQLSACSDGRRLRSVKQVIVKKDGTEHHINGFMTKNEPDGKELKVIIGLLLKVMPKTADLTSVLKDVKAAIKERAE